MGNILKSTGREIIDHRYMLSGLQERISQLRTYKQDFNFFLNRNLISIDKSRL